MVKVSITLPNATQITVESEEPELIHEVVGMALRELPKELLQASNAQQAGLSSSPASEKGTSVASPAGNTGTGTTEASPDSPNAVAAPMAAYSQSGGPRKSTPRASRGSGVTQESTEPQHSGDSAEAFAQFCRSANPVGDMRRVVVAAEGADRFLGMESVDSPALASLFELAGWRLPHNFTQTLRNAARGKFQWLERIPGRAGRYSVTPVGRSITLSE